MIEQLLKDRYLLPGENSWKDLCLRVSNFLFPDQEQKREHLYRLMEQKKFIPSSPTLMNAGTNMPQLASCFSCSIDDNLNSIMDAMKRASRIFQLGGGCGADFSNIRPCGALINSTGTKSDGIIPFINIFDVVVSSIKQGGRRRGAAISTLDITHPDIVEFIKCKTEDGKLSNMNISIRVTDDFMEAVRDDENWVMEFGDIKKTMRARELWDLICESAHKYGDPGIIFIDTIKNTIRDKTILSKYTPISNPCLYEDSLMFTINGLERISTSANNKIWNGDEYSDCKLWSNGIKDTIKIITKSGFEWIVTPDHKFMLEDGSWCEAQNLMDKKIKIEIKDHNWEGHNPYPECNYSILGFEFGDGTFHKASNRMKYIFYTPEKDQEVADLITSVFGEEPVFENDRSYIKIPYGGIYANAFCGTLPERMIPDWVLTLPKDRMKEFLRGIFSANGCNLHKYHRVTMTGSNHEMLQQVQQMLLLFGIKAKLWHKSYEKTITFKNGDYICKNSWNLVISSESYIKFLNTIGFIQSYKNGYNKDNNYQPEKEYEIVIDIVDTEKLDVWDFSEPINNYGICYGAYVHNCSEAVLLGGDGYSDQCNLGSIDISKYSYEDEDELKADIELAIDALNAVIDKTIFPHPDNEKITKEIRQIGLGYMGIADRLIKDGISFGSLDGNQFIYDITKFINDISRKYSDRMGYNNLSVTCLAPTGSIALIAGCSAGIEPNFAYVYDRSIWKDNVPVKHRMLHPLFDKYLNKNCDSIRKNVIVEHMYNHGTIQNCLNADAEMRRLFVTAKDLTPEQHLVSVEMAQKNIEMGISKTINMPNSATVDDVKFVYERAWRCGLKGITVYREGSREIEVLSTNKNEIPETTNPQQNGIIPKSHPDVMDSITVRRYSGCGTLWVNLTLDDENKPFAVFIKQSEGGCAANLNAIARLISANLRSGVDVQYIINQLKSERCMVAMKSDKSQGKSCSHIIGSIIEDYVNGKIIQKHQVLLQKPTTAARMTGLICPDCGNELIYAEGCRNCMSCGWSRCD